MRVSSCAPQDLINQLRRKLKARDEDLRSFQERSEELAEAKALLSAGGCSNRLCSFGPKRVVDKAFAAERFYEQDALRFHRLVL